MTGVVKGGIRDCWKGGSLQCGRTCRVNIRLQLSGFNCFWRSCERHCSMATSTLSFCRTEDKFLFGVWVLPRPLELYPNTAPNSPHQTPRFAPAAECHAKSLHPPVGCGSDDSYNDSACLWLLIIFSFSIMIRPSDPGNYQNLSQA